MLDQTIGALGTETLWVIEAFRATVLVARVELDAEVVIVEEAVSAALEDVDDEAPRPCRIRAPTSTDEVKIVSEEVEDESDQDLSAVVIAWYDCSNYSLVNPAANALPVSADIETAIVAMPCIQTMAAAKTERRDMKVSRLHMDVHVQVYNQNIGAPFFR